VSTAEVVPVFTVDQCIVELRRRAGGRAFLGYRKEVA